MLSLFFRGFSTALYMIVYPSRMPLFYHGLAMAPLPSGSTIATLLFLCGRWTAAEDRGALSSPSCPQAI